MYVIVTFSVYVSIGFRLQSTVLGGIIVCALRSKDSEHGVKMAELAAKYLQKSKSDPIGVVGFDVAGDEGNYPLNSLGCPMLRGIKKAQELGTVYIYSNSKLLAPVVYFADANKLLY